MLHSALVGRYKCNILERAVEPKYLNFDLIISEGQANVNLNLEITVV